MPWQTECHLHAGMHSRPARELLDSIQLPIEAVSRRDVMYGAASAAILPLFNTTPAVAADSSSRSAFCEMIPVAPRV